MNSFATEVKSLAYRTDRCDRVCDIFLIIIVCFIPVLMSYHPFFFGDELSAKRLAIINSFSIPQVFFELNHYKPRFVFNSVMSIIAGFELGRSALAVIIGGALSLFCVALYYLVINVSGNNRIIAILVPISVVMSRFGQTFYFDYVSGSIELLSALLTIFVLCGALRIVQESASNWKTLMVTIIAELCCVFVHERYAAGFFFMGIGLVLSNIRIFWPVMNLRFLIFSIVFSLAPGLLFWISNQVWGQNDILLASGGKTASLDISSVITFLFYCVNVVLNGNWGDSWFWGSINFSSELGFPLGVTSILLTVLIFFILHFVKGYDLSRVREVVPVISLAIGLLAIGSLAGSDHMHSRFAYVPSILFLLSTIYIVKSWYRLLPIILVVSLNLIYLILGSANDIANIYSSRASKGLATSLVTLNPSGGRGLIIGNDHDNKWTFANNESFSEDSPPVHTYSVVNLENGITIEPFGLRQSYNLEDYDFALVFSGFHGKRVPYYEMVSPERAFVLKGLLSVDMIPPSLVFGQKDRWDTWKWNIKPEEAGGNIFLKPGMEGFYGLQNGELRGKLLVYRVRANSGTKVKMRVQINWHTDEKFLQASISILEVGREWISGVMNIMVPKSATYGFVYLQLHDGETNAAEIESVSIR